MAKNGGKKQVITVKGTVVRVDYPTIKKFVVYDLAAADEKLSLQQQIHGVKQRLGDAESGKSPIEKFEMASRIIESFGEQSWELTSRTVDLSLVIEAVAKVKGVTADVIRAVLEPLEDGGVERCKEWRGSSKVKAAMLQIQADRALAAANDSDDDIEI